MWILPLLVSRPKHPTSLPHPSNRYQTIGLRRPSPRLHIPDPCNRLWALLPIRARRGAHRLHQARSHLPDLYGLRATCPAVRRRPTPYRPLCALHRQSCGLLPEPAPFPGRQADGSGLPAQLRPRPRQPLALVPTFQSTKLQ
nr:hypothetical protein CFP56_04102 [Quercus suber]